jgi:hypothetical protein
MFRFSIRDVLWLTLVAALATGWYRDRIDTSRLKAETAAQHDADKKALQQQLAILQADMRAKVNAALEEVGFQAVMADAGVLWEWRATKDTKDRVNELMLGRSILRVDDDGTLLDDKYQRYSPSQK